ncbi:MAG: PDZ domain-containing protein [Chloroflexi bacterium]|nr:PDZ domain-containing protein [Chloroflexota bacterium]
MFALIAAAAVSAFAFGPAPAWPRFAQEVATPRPVPTSTPMRLPTPTSPAETIPPPLPTATPRPAPPVSLDPALDFETEINTRVYELVNPSVVAVRVLDQDLLDEEQDVQPFFFDSGEGSGFVIGAEGYIVTNNHVVEDAESIVVQFYDGLLAPAELMGADPDTDLAVLKVDPRGLDLQPVSFGNIDDLRVGQRVLVIGNPFGNANTLTTGIISALGRQIALPGSPFRLPEVIQTDAAINPGNSGGPMLNARGEVIGVAFMLQSTTRANSGVGFGIPVYFVERVSKAIIERGSYEHPWIGIRGTTLSPFMIRELGLEAERGVLISEVVPGGPAAKAGLRGGDREVTLEGVDFLVGGDVIVAIDDRPVKVFDDLLAYLGRYTEPGMEITLTILRDGEIMRMPLTLEPRPKTLR